MRPSTPPARPRRSGPAKPPRFVVPPRPPLLHRVVGWGARVLELSPAHVPSPLARWAHLGALLALPLSAVIGGIWVRGALTPDELWLRRVETTALLFAGLACWLLDRLGQAGWNWPVRREPLAQGTRRPTARRQTRIQGWRSKLDPWVPSWTGILSIALASIGFTGALDFLLVLEGPPRPLLGQVFLWTGWCLSFLPFWLWMFSTPRRWKLRRGAGAVVAEGT